MLQLHVLFMERHECIHAMRSTSLAPKEDFCWGNMKIWVGIE